MKFCGTQQIDNKTKDTSKSKNASISTNLKPHCIFWLTLSMSVLLMCGVDTTML